MDAPENGINFVELGIPNLNGPEVKAEPTDMKEGGVIEEIEYKQVEQEAKKDPKKMEILEGIIKRESTNFQWLKVGLNWFMIFALIGLNLLRTNDAPA